MRFSGLFRIICENKITWFTQIVGDFDFYLRTVDNHSKPKQLVQLQNQLHSPHSTTYPNDDEDVLFKRFWLVLLRVIPCWSISANQNRSYIMTFFINRTMSWHILIIRSIISGMISFKKSPFKLIFEIFVFF